MPLALSGYGFHAHRARAREAWAWRKEGRTVKLPKFLKKVNWKELAIRYLPKAVAWFRRRREQRKSEKTE
jgi:hypothetical protein